MSFIDKLNLPDFMFEQTGSGEDPEAASIRLDRFRELMTACTVDEGRLDQELAPHFQELERLKQAAQPTMAAANKIIDQALSNANEQPTHQVIRPAIAADQPMVSPTLINSRPSTPQADRISNAQRLVEEARVELDRQIGNYGGEA